MTATPTRLGQGMLEAIMDSAVGAIVTIDNRGIIQSVNPATEKLFGHPECELLGRNVSVLMPEPHKSRHDEYLAAHLRTGECKIIGIGRNVEALRQNGSLCPVHLSVSAFEINQNKYFTGILHDLSASERLKAEANRQAALFQTVFDNVPEAMFIAGLDWQILWANPAATRVFGYAHNEFIGRNAEILYENVAEFSRVGNLLKTIDGTKGKSHRPLFSRFRHKDGHTFAGEMIAAAIHGPNGEKTAVLGLVRDLTLQQKEEEARLKSQRLEAIGQLTGGIAHDFNNLLTIISGNLELLETDIQSERGQDHLRRAQGAADAGGRLTNRLLTFARRKRLEPQVVPLNDQVSMMTELLQRTLGANIKLTTKLDPNLWVARVDPSEIENAILNIAINACDAMPSGGRLIIKTGNVALEPEGSGQESTLIPGDYVRLSVSDTGCGMSKDVLRRAFEPFFTTKPTGRGTGLGLSTIFGFVKQSGGHVTIYSELGQGTTVNLYLPRHQTTQPVDPAVAKTQVVAKAAGETILVVEDNPDVRAVVVERLLRLGYFTVEAETAVEAMEKLECGLKVDAVFSDVVMPGGLSGFDLARWVLTNRAGVGILLTSGFAEDVMLPNIADHIPILRKPYAQADLERMLRDAVDRKTSS